MPLERLDLSATDIDSLDALVNLPLRSLNLADTSVRNISVLTNLPLEELRLDGCEAITDFTPLASMKLLKRLTLPPAAVTPELLNQLSGVMKLGTHWPTNGWKGVPALARTNAPAPPR